MFSFSKLAWGPLHRAFIQGHRYLDQRHCTRRVVFTTNTYSVFCRRTPSNCRPQPCVTGESLVRPSCQCSVFPFPPVLCMYNPGCRDGNLDARSPTISIPGSIASRKSTGLCIPGTASCIRLVQDICNPYASNFSRPRCWRLSARQLCMTADQPDSLAGSCATSAVCRSTARELSLKHEIPCVATNAG
jgi:hypothetical protein